MKKIRFSYKDIIHSKSSGCVFLIESIIEHRYDYGWKYLLKPIAIINDDEIELLDDEINREVSIDFVNHNFNLINKHTLSTLKKLMVFSS